jgi:tetratricopeptide (TPR) repeat protein
VDLEEGPDNSMLADEIVYRERQFVRTDSVALLCEGNAGASVSRLRTHFSRVSAEYERNRYYDIYELLTDGLLLAKAYIQNDELNIARQLLVSLAGTLVSHSTTHNFHPAAAFRSDEGKEVRASLSYAQLKRKMSVYSVLGNLLHVCGDAVNAEKMYIQYSKLVEVHLGLRSLEASNVCFMLGLFYISRNLLKKALECFKRARAIRLEHFGETHEVVGDCEYNLGLLYRRLGNRFKAHRSLSRALEIRTANSSESSLQTAQVLEALGVFEMENENFENAYRKLDACCEIRKRLLKQTDDHAEIERVKDYMATLNHHIDVEGQKEQFVRLELSKFKFKEAPSENHSPEKSAGHRQQS